jgi:peptide chain release factor subunit 1
MFVAASLGVFECVEIDDEATKVVISRFHYHCGRRFDTQPLRDAVDAASVEASVAYIVMGGDGFTLANVRESDGHITVVARPHDPHLAKKHNKGGQSAPRFGRLQLESRAAYVRQAVEAAERAWPAPCKLVVCGTAQLKEQLVAALPAALARALVRVHVTSANGLDGLQQCVASTLADVVGSAQLHADLGELERLMEALRVDAGAADSYDASSALAIGAREVRAALRLHAVESLLVHNDAPFASALVAHNRNVDDDGDGDAGDVAQLVASVRVVRISSQSPSAEQVRMHAPLFAVIVG